MDNLLKPTTEADLIAPIRNARSTSTLVKLHDMFKPTDFVRVINPDTEMYVWQYLPEHKEHISFEGSSTTVPQKITVREDPEVYKLEAGQSGVIPGASAYVMIDGLVKRMMAKRVIQREPDMKPGQARNFNFSDDMAQEYWIDQIYMGVVEPFAASTPAPDRAHEINRRVEEDLGIAEGDFPQKAPRTVHPA